MFKMSPPCNNLAEQNWGDCTDSWRRRSLVMLIRCGATPPRHERQRPLPDYLPHPHDPICGMKSASQYLHPLSSFPYPPLPSHSLLTSPPPNSLLPFQPFLSLSYIPCPLSPSYFPLTRSSPTLSAPLTNSLSPYTRVVSSSRRPYP